MSRHFVPLRLSANSSDGNPNHQSNLRFSRVGAIEYHDKQSSVIACLAAFMRLSGYPVHIDHIIDLAPIPEAGADDALLARIGRHIGVVIMPLPSNGLAPKHWHAHDTLMVRDASGYWFLLWPADETCFLAGLPGLPDSLRRLSADSEILGTIVKAYTLRKLPFSPRLGRALRPPKLWLMLWLPRYAGLYDAKAVDKLRLALSVRNIKERQPVALDALTPGALRASHQSLVAGPSPIHGSYRRLNMRRGDTLFVDYNALESSVRILLTTARQHRAADVSGAIDFSAKLFADFLSIHPFLNGNRRMAILLVTCYLAPWNLDVDWSRINSTQYNFWMRCTQRGHFSVLLQGFHDHLIEKARLPLCAATGC